MAKAKTGYERKLAYNNQYNRENYRSFSIRYDKNSEKKVIRWLEKQPGVKEYVTGLILKDMGITAPEKAKPGRKKAAPAKKAAKKK